MRYTKEDMMGSWLDEDLGSQELPDLTETEDVAGIDSVVDGFLRNEAGFTRDEVNRYVNRALQNEAQALTQLNQWSEELADSASEQAKALSEEYDEGRRGLAETMSTLRSEKKVLIAAETGDALVQLDHDGQMSQNIGVDVSSYYGSDHSAAVNSLEAAMASGQFVQENAASPQHQQGSAVEAGRDPVHVSEPLAETMSMIDSRRQRFLSEMTKDDIDLSPEDQGPEID